MTDNTRDRLSRDRVLGQSCPIPASSRRRRASTVTLYSRSLAFLFVFSNFALPLAVMTKLLIPLLLVASATALAVPRGE
jgi:hypothetical protein